ncbi:uncharacterized protein LOC125662370 isoform X3 [Ostrea edulis]|uniref:uncharacterized protein LOC125662370 isoform X3 n=1 Tax=Ostrea edulis TaxID=37623 RepID=UPI0024AFE20D|nr:uncharacterized protein LOC125662370 isoform X3 [Ostrea edulis]
MEYTSPRGEVKPKKKRFLQRKAEHRKQELHEPESDNFEGRKNDHHLTSEENEDAKPGVHQISNNDLVDENTVQTPADIGMSIKGLNESDDEHDENQESEKRHRRQNDTIAAEDIRIRLKYPDQEQSEWNNPQSFKDNEHGENRQEGATEEEESGGNGYENAESGNANQTPDDTRIKEDSGDESSSSSGTDSDSETFSSNTGTSDEDKCREKVGSNEALEIFNDIGEDNLSKNENGKYEWQWRNENGWEEGRKHESTNLQDVLRTRKNEKGFIIKTKNGYKWKLLPEESIIEDNTSTNIPEGGGNDDLNSKNYVENTVQSFVEKNRKIIFIGPVGSGKSATINTLLGENRAPSENNLKANSLTKEITEYESEYGILFDTPGLSDESLPSVLNYMDRNPPDVIVLVFAASRLRSSQKEAIQQIKFKLGTYFSKAFLLLTKGGDLQDNEHDFIDNEKSEEICSLYSSVGKRCVVFENGASMEEKQKYICKFKDSIRQILNHEEDSSTSLMDSLLDFI